MMISEESGKVSLKKIINGIFVKDPDPPPPLMKKKYLRLAKFST